MKEHQLSALPQVEILLNAPSLVQYHTVLSRPVTADIIRAVLNKVRSDALEQDIPVPHEDVIISRISLACDRQARERLQRVVNATGIIIHTNMGRSLLSKEVWDAAGEMNCGYSNLELDLNNGKRGKRKGLIPSLLAKLTGAEDALVVNNNAAAVHLILSTFAVGKEVIVSRGEQVQIGGGFRVPEILRASGARLVEVGTTNITKLEDYEEAISEKTGMLLSVHRSNFAIRGFEESTSVKKLSSLKNDDIILCVDQGSGVIGEKIPGEVSVRNHLASGADLVCFSGDKIFSGPQSGLIVGRKDLIAKLEKHPLMRVFRPGKTIYSLLELTLIQHLNGHAGIVPRLLSQSLEGMREKGERLLQGLDPERFSIVESTCMTGGGSAPDEYFPSLSVRCESTDSPQKLLRQLRESHPPVIAFIHEDRIHLNLATIDLSDLSYLSQLLGEL